MRVNSTRPAAVAGSWYPESPGALALDIDRYVDSARDGEVPLSGRLHALIAPHAGLMFSGPVGAHAYVAAANAGPYDAIIIAGPSHFVAFDGVALYPAGAFATPLGPAVIHESIATDLLAAAPLVQTLPAAHSREHSIEMQLPFIRRLLPQAAIVPLLMGRQVRDTIGGLADALASVVTRRDERILLVASTDLSHYFDASKAAALDQRVLRCVSACDADGLLSIFEEHPEGERGRFVACGGGPAIAVMRAARALGAGSGRVLKYMHSGQISGDNTAVVGYVAGALGSFADAH